MALDAATSAAAALSSSPPFTTSSLDDVEATPLLLLLNSPLSSSTRPDQRKPLLPQPSSYHSIQDAEEEEEDGEEEEEEKAMAVGKEEEEEGEEEMFVPSPRRAAVLVALMVLGLVENFSLALPSAFFPNDSLARGVTQLQIGIVNAAVSVTALVGIPVVGWILRVAGRERHVILVGVLAEVVAYIAFALLALVEQADFFFIGCLTSNILIGAGLACTETCMLTLVAVFYADKPGFARSIVEMSMGVGYVFGPVLGGLLHSAGGFALPYAIQAAVLALSLIFLGWALARATRHVVEKEGGAAALPSAASAASTTRTAPLWLMTFAGAWALPSIISVFFSCLPFGSLASTLAPLMDERYKFDSLRIGLVFGACAFSYMLGCFVCGLITDKSALLRQLAMLVGMLTTGVGILCTGPSSLLDSFMPESLWLMILALVAIGFGAAFAFVPPFTELVAAPFVGEKNAYIVSAVCAGMMQIGMFVGAVTGSGLTEEFGFSVSTTVFGLSILGAFAFMLLYIWLLHPLTCGRYLPTSASARRYAHLQSPRSSVKRPSSLTHV